MAYYYQDLNHGGYECKYTDYGNHGNGDYGYKDDSCSDHSEPDQYKPNHTHSEPDHYIHDHDDHGLEHEVAQHETTGEDHEHRELVHNDEETGIDWAAGHKGEVKGYEHGQLKYEVNEIHEHSELICDDDELLELKELKRMVNEDGYEPQGPDSRYEETQEPPQCTYKLEHELEYSDDGTSKYEDHEDRNRYTYPRHLPPVSTMRDNHNPHTTTHYPTTYVHHNPTCALCHTQQAEPNADELFELEELSRMYTKWGHEPPKPTALHSAYGGMSDSTTITPAPSPPPHSPPLHSPTSPSLPLPTPNKTPPSISRPSAKTSTTESRVLLHLCGNSGTTPGNACTNRRNGVRTGGRKPTKTTTSPTRSAITSPDHGHGMRLMNPKMAYPASLRDCAPFVPGLNGAATGTVVPPTVAPPTTVPHNFGHLLNLKKTK
jgi:hypothetical protein